MDIIKVVEMENPDKLTKQRKGEYEIRTEIQKALDLRPMAYYELSKQVGINPETARKHAEYLVKIGAIEKVMFKDLDTKIKEYYKKK